ncbi:MAG: msrA [Citricoccus sp.]|jgi:peptide-methionine (S)-S-oxide reductase|nr:msrA [Citricoccus sp. WCRC_4]
MNPRSLVLYPVVSDDVRENQSDDVTGPRGAHRVLTVAGGCFWCLDAVYRRIRGITAVESGYTGSDWPDPVYETVCSGITGHAEAVRVGFDESVISAEMVLDIFFTGHDPTTLNRQGHDVGTQYRSALFAADAEDEALFRSAIERNQDNWDAPIVTTIEPAARWYPAEWYHQDFYTNRPDAGYCHVIITPKLARVRQRYSAWLVEPQLSRPLA